jgi:hypothetical protein
MTSAPDFNVGCGHYVPPGSRFCPECGRAVAASAGAGAGADADPEPAPVVAVDPPDRPKPPRWPWEVDSDDELHAVRSDPTVVPPADGGRSAAPGGPPRGGRRRPLLLMIAAGVVVVAIVVVGVVVLNRHPAKPVAGPTTKATHSARPSTSPTPTYVQLRATPEGQAAVALAGLLQQAQTRLGDVSGAQANVLDCKPKLATDKQTFFNAADSRRDLLTALAKMPQRGTLPTTLMDDLTGGWQQENDNYSLLGLWATDAVQHGCHTKTIKDDGYLQDSYGHANQATADMKKFVSLWDPIATKYSLSTYQYWKI